MSGKKGKGKFPSEERQTDRKKEGLKRKTDRVKNRQTKEKRDKETENTAYHQIESESKLE